MKKTFTKLAAILCVICMFASITPTASAAAAQHFSDVNPSSACYTAVEYFYGKGAISGSNGKFNPDQYLTGPEFAVMTVNVFFPDAQLGTSSIWWKPSMDFLLSGGYISNAEYALMTSGAKATISNEVVWNVILPIVGVYPYPAELFDNVLTQENVTGVYADARAAAVTIGIADNDTNALYPPTRGEFVNMLYRLVTGDYTPLPEYESELIFLQHLDVNRESYHARNSIIRSFFAIPERFREDFIDNEWDIKFSSHIELMQGDKDVSGGIIVYDEKTIYLNKSTETTLPHEFGHYVAWKYNLTCIRDYYKAEAKNTTNVLRDYARTSEQEFFAEVFANYIMHPEKRDAMKTACPMTYSLVENLITNG